MGRLWLAASASLLVIGLLFARVAIAAPAEATKLFEEGRELAKQGRHAEACDRFTKSLSLDPAPGTKLNLGDCLERQGQTRRAWQLFEEAARDWDRAKDSRAKYARERATAVSAKLATLVVKLAEPGLAGTLVRIADQPATVRPEITERVDPGTVAVVVSAPDRASFESTVQASAGKTHVVEVPALAPTAEPGSVAPWAAPNDPSPRAEAGARTRSRVRLALAIGGAGALGAKSTYDSAFDEGHCFREETGNECDAIGKARIDDAVASANVATWIAVGGGALVVTGAIIFLTAPRERVTVRPAATPTSVGLALSARF